MEFPTSPSMHRLPDGALLRGYMECTHEQIAGALFISNLKLGLFFLFITLYFLYIIKHFLLNPTFLQDYMNSPVSSHHRTHSS